MALTLHDEASVPSTPVQSKQGIHPGSEQKGGSSPSRPPMTPGGGKRSRQRQSPKAGSVATSYVALGRYRLPTKESGEEPLGQGGLCVVWRGQDEELQKGVAVKTYRLQVKRQEGQENLAARFSEEIATFRRLGVGPHSGGDDHRASSQDMRRLFVNLLDYSKDVAGDPASTPRGGFYTVLELATDSLTDMLRRRKADASVEEVGKEVVDVGRAVASGLAALHDLRLVHLDVKPENVMRFGDHWKLIDLESVRSVGSGAGVSPDCLTPLYLAPELARFLLERLESGTAAASLDGFDVNPALDNWALGLLLLDVAAGGRALDEDYASFQQCSLFEEDSEPPFAGWYRWLSSEAPLQVDGLVPPARAGGAWLRRFAPILALVKGLTSKAATGRSTAREAAELLAVHVRNVTDTPPAALPAGAAAPRAQSAAPAAPQASTSREEGPLGRILRQFSAFDRAGSGLIPRESLVCIISRLGVDAKEAMRLVDAICPVPCPATFAGSGKTCQSADDLVSYGTFIRALF
eukprot:TRINITY_DN20696_c0_g1_i1.p1 TRINITY_DN20696_c0_g1~~TRINITY_DN20696_c0_g1_i1.p1  ORF type:complete len:521 (-),score=111.40 TRINITY_DN20696_c0_g1_i1:49-1611(-)